MKKIKGLNAYIKKHGRHFTKDLAEDICHKWDYTQIKTVLDKKVYYNTTSSTSGDITYLVNRAYHDFFPVVNTKERCIDYALAIIGGVDCYEGIAFSGWIADLIIRDKDFDLSNYI